MINVFAVSPGVFVALTILRASIWSSVFMVGAGPAGGVSEPWAKALTDKSRERRVEADVRFINFPRGGVFRTQQRNPRLHHRNLRNFRPRMTAIPSLDAVSARHFLLHHKPCPKLSLV